MIILLFGVCVCHGGVNFRQGSASASVEASRSSASVKSSESARMSSALFARGTMTQVGQRRRAEEVNKNISDLRDTLETVKDLPRDFRVLNTRMSAMETHTATITSMNKTVAELTEKIASQQVTITALQETLSKYGDMDALLERMSTIESKIQDNSSFKTELEAVDTLVKEHTAQLTETTVKISKMNGRVITLEKAAAPASN